MIDPTKLNPKAIAELSELMRSLTPEQMMKMQSIMHNTMAGFNVTHEMAEFEKTLPSHFREKIARIMYIANGIAVPDQPTSSAAPSSLSNAQVAESASYPPVTEAINNKATAGPTNETEARLVILRSLAQGLLQPEEALKVLFPE